MTLALTLISTNLQIQIQKAVNTENVDSLKKIFDDLQNKQVDDTRIKYITAIGSQWPMVLLIVTVTFVIAYRKKIGAWASNIHTVKGGLGSANVEFTTVRSEEVTVTSLRSSQSDEDETDSTESKVLSAIQQESEDQFTLWSLYKGLNKSGLTEGREIYEKLQAKTHSDPL
jgi:hypothetical protein